MGASAVNRAAATRRSRKLPEPARTFVRNGLRLPSIYPKPVFRAAVGRAVDALWESDNRDFHLEVVTRLTGQEFPTLRAWRLVGAIFPNDDDIERAVAVPRANGTRLTWAHFEALGPLAELPRDERLQKAKDLLARARAQNLSAREIRKAAKEIRDTYKSAVPQVHRGEQDSPSLGRRGGPLESDAGVVSPRDVSEGTAPLGASGASEDGHDNDQPKPGPCGTSGV